MSLLLPLPLRFPSVRPVRSASVLEHDEQQPILARAVPLGAPQLALLLCGEVANSEMRFLCTAMHCEKQVALPALVPEELVLIYRRRRRRARRLGRSGGRESWDTRTPVVVR